MPEVKVKCLLESITKDTNFYEVCRGNRILRLKTLRHSKIEPSYFNGIPYLELFSARRSVLSLKGIVKLSLIMFDYLIFTISYLFLRELESPLPELDSIYNCEVMW